MERRKLTDRFIGSLQTDDPRGLQVHDTDVKEFGVTVHPGKAGRRVFWVLYRRPIGKGRRRYILGDAGTKPADEFRDDARLVLADVLRKQDPAGGGEPQKEAPPA